MLDILTVPNATLRQVSQPVKKVDKKFIQFVDQLIDTLLKKTDPPGVGVSAIQVGKPLRVFITYLPADPDLPSDKWTKDNLQIKLYINPTITAKSKRTTLGGSFRRPFLEGCLSIPNIYGPAKRHKWIEVEYQTLPMYSPDGSTAASGDFSGADMAKSSNATLITQSETLTNFPARVFQHEYDHLEGILFTDYTTRDNHPLYFDQGKDLVEIANPQELITW